MVGLLTGHCYLKAHLSKLELVNSPKCKRCLEKEASASHVLCDCEAITYLRFCHRVQYFMKPGDYHDVLIRKVLHFMRSVLD
jgi:hypothetical protein